MLKSYFHIALRNLRKHKVYTCINVVGLAIGIAVCALIFMWVRDELSCDRFNLKADRTYRVLWDARFGDNEWTLARTPIPLADVLQNQIPEVEDVVRFTTATRTLRLGQDWVDEKDVLSVEQSFFDVFTVPFVSGNPQTALNDPNAVILTEGAARRYFGNQDPVGQSLEVNNGDVLKVTAIVKEFPPQSHFHFDFLLPLDVTKYSAWQEKDWGSPPVYTYLVVKQKGQAASVEAKLKDYIRREIIPNSPLSLAPGQNRYGLPLQKLTDIHLRSHADMELSPGGSITYVYLFSFVGLLILLLACINFVNLATARSADRAREVGVRKVLGSHRIQLIRQFLAESFLHVLLALLLAVVLIELVLPAFNTFVGKQLRMDYFGSPFALLLLCGMALVVALLAGLYPAFVLSAFRPVQALKGSSAKPRRNLLRNGLVVLQFCISIGLIAATLIVRSQLHFVMSTRLGFDKEHVLVVENAGTLGKQYVAFRDRLQSDPLVASASATSALPGYVFDSTIFEPEQPANYKESSITYSWIDPYYLDALGIKVMEGRNFSSTIPTDSSAFLINQAAAQALGWKDPIGKTLSRGMSSRAKGPVIGIVENFHFESLHDEIKPLIFPFVQWPPPYIAVRLKPGNTAAGVAAVRNLWDEFAPQRPLSYTFLDQDYQKLYTSDRRMAQVFSIFAALALFIACLGLFGLASYVAAQRTKEIGIRKVLGASVRNIVLMLTREFALFVLVAFVVAAPLVYVGMSRWLEDFAYRIDMPWAVFLAAGIGALVVALATVSYQAVKAALADPVKSLRYE